MQQPNIVLIVADDMGFSDIGCFGSEIATPHLDALGYGGLRATQLYNGARCCPSRAALISGRYAHEAGIGHMTKNLGHPGYEGYLLPSVLSIAEILNLHGYTSLMAGKWHLGGDYTTNPADWNPGTPETPRPIDRGFAEHYGTLHGAGSYYAPHTLIENAEMIDEFGEDFYYTDEIGRRAVRMIEDHGQAEAPFFLYVAHVAPHWPLHAHQEDIDRYSTTYLTGWDAIRKNRLDRGVEMGLLSPEWGLSPRDQYSVPWTDVEHPEWEASRMAVYAAQVESMDRTIGELVAALDRTGQRDNTLIVFYSDNGGCAELLAEDGEIDLESAPTHTPDGRRVVIGNLPTVAPGPDDTYMSYGLPWANTSNAPFRLFKHWVHEGGISTPAIFNWPAEIDAGRITHEPMHLIDVTSTFEHLAAGPMWLADRHTRGESIASLLGGEEWSRSEPMYWEHEGNRAVRNARWKLVARSGQPWELYDMEHDRTEVVDLAAGRPEIVTAMNALYEQWAESVGVVEWAEIKAKFPSSSKWVDWYDDPHLDSPNQLATGGPGEPARSGTAQKRMTQ